MSATAIADYTKIKQIRAYKCAVCRNATIAETRTAQRPNLGENPANIPDQMNFDPNIYSEPVVRGGKLFKDKPEESWKPKAQLCGVDEETIPIGLLHLNVSLPIGGICDECLKDITVKRLMPHIKFE